MVAEAFAPSFGVLGLGGVVAFVIGALMLIDTDVPGFGVPLALIVAARRRGQRAVVLLGRAAWRCERAGARWSAARGR